MVCSILRASDLVGPGRTWELAFSTSCPGDTVAPGLWTHFGNHWLKLTSVRLMLPLLHTEIHVARKEAWEGLAGGSTLLSCGWEKGPPNSVSFSTEESLLWQRIYNRFFFFCFFLCVLSLCSPHCNGFGHPRRENIYLGYSWWIFRIQLTKKGSNPSWLLLKLDS